MTDHTAFEYLTPQVLDNFAALGTEMLLSILAGPIASPSPSPANPAPVLFTETLMAVDEGILDVDSAVKFLRSALNTDHLAVLFCQVVDMYPCSEQTRQVLQRMADDETALPAATMAAHIDAEILVAIGLLPADAYGRQLSTRKRDQYYTQKKFNLIHEEFEGYSLVISEMEAVLSQQNNAALVDSAVATVNQLMGHYLLDPNRVLDVLLYVFANMLIGNHTFILSFLRKSLWWPQTPADCTTGLDGLNTGGCAAAAHCILLQMRKFPGSELPETFKALVAILIKEGFVNFGAVYASVPPGAEAMALLEKAYRADLENEAVRASASALALAAPLRDDSVYPEEHATEETTRMRAEPPSVEELARNNLKLQMLRVFLANGLFWPSVYVLTQYPFLAHVDKEVGELMNRLLVAIIAPMHVKSAAGQRAGEGETSHLKDDLRTVRQYCFKPTIKKHGNKQYVYFYQEWAERLPRCHSREDLFTVSQQLLKFYGPVLAQNPAVFTQICEIIAHEVAQDASDAGRAAWLDYFRNYIFPYMGHVLDSTAIDKAYAVLEIYSREERYNVYGELYQVVAKNNAFVKIAFGKAERATKDALKRLSKDNMAQMMKQLAQISVNTPLPCFLTVLQQLESYDNLNALVVNTAASFSRYTWDNMTLALLMRLSAPGRSNVLANGLNDRRWILSLASFIGELACRYPAQIDLETIVDYCIKSLHVHDAAPLLVLKELVASMGGIQAITNLTAPQVDHMCCAESVAQKVLQTIGDTRYTRAGSAAKLVRTLLAADRASELVVLLARLDRQLVADSAVVPVKVLAVRRDEVSAVVHAMCSLLAYFCKEKPGLVALQPLVARYSVPVAWAFETWRAFLDPAHCFSDCPAFSTNVDTRLFYTFWLLALYDVNYSADVYDTELAKLRAAALQQREELSVSSDTGSIQTNLQRIEVAIAQIQRESAAHEAHDRTVLVQLRENCAVWFGDKLSFNTESDPAHPANPTYAAFLQDCILPRAVNSCFDAMFCARFLFRLHESGTEHFSILDALGLLVHSNAFFATLFSCTPVQADNLGLFLAEVLLQLDRWRNEDAFAAQQQTAPLRTAAGPVSARDFRRLLFSWHETVLSDISRALQVSAYMARANAITFLKKLFGVFPVVEDHFEEVTRLLEHLAKHDARDDIKLASSALIGHVRSHESHWVHEWDFYDMDEKARAAQEAKRSRVDAAKKIAAGKRQQELEVQTRLKVEKEQTEAAGCKSHERNSHASASAIDYSEKAAPPRPAERVKQQAQRGRYDRYAGAGQQTGKSAEKKGDLETLATALPQVPWSTKNASKKREEVSKEVYARGEARKYVSVTRDVSSTGDAKAGDASNKVDTESSDLFSKKLSKKEERYDRESEASGGRRTPVGPRATSPVPAKPQSAKQSGKAHSERTALLPQQPPARQPLPPQQAPRDVQAQRSREPRQHTQPNASTQRRPPLPPQSIPAAESRPRDRHESRNDQSGRERDRREPGRDSGRDSRRDKGRGGRDRDSRDRESGRDRDKHSSRGQPSSQKAGAQQKNRSRSQTPHTSGYNALARTSVYNVSRRSTPNPLPSPTLPPPSVPPPRNGDQNKRPYEDDRPRDKRRR